MWRSGQLVDERGAIWLCVCTRTCLYVEIASYCNEAGRGCLAYHRTAGNAVVLKTFAWLLHNIFALYVGNGQLWWRLTCLYSLLLWLSPPSMPLERRLAAEICSRKNCSGPSSTYIHIFFRALINRSYNQSLGVCLYICICRPKWNMSVYVHAGKAKEDYKLLFECCSE